MKDLEKNRKRLEEALARDSLLNESQKENVRRKAADLEEGRIRWQSVPFRLVVEFNRKCNGNCVHCDIERKDTGELDFRRFEDLMEEVGRGTMEILPFLAGEPTLGPVRQVAATARKYNNYLTFCSNGLQFTREFYQPISDITGRVSFSLNSHRAEVCRSLMPNMDFERVTANIKAAVSIAETTGAQIVTGLLVMNSNLKELDDYIHFVADLGVRRASFMKLYPDTPTRAREGLENHHSPQEIRDHLRRALRVAKERGVYIETNLEEIFGDPDNVKTVESPFDLIYEKDQIVSMFRPGFCISTAVTSIIEWDGTVLPCTQNHIALGNLNRSPFMDLWNGDVMSALRKTFLEKEPHSYCRSCMNFYCLQP